MQQMQQQKNLSAVMENARTGSSKHRHERRHRQALCHAGSAPSLCFAFLVVQQVEPSAAAEC